MSLFGNKPSASTDKPSGIVGAFQADIIKWEPENDTETIVHKFEAEDFPNGSKLIVAPSMTAVFINYVSSGDSLEGNGDGKAQVSVFNGPVSITLQTGDSRFAPFKKVVNAFTGGETAFHSYVYFIKNIHMTDLSWGVGIPAMTDPETGLMIKVGALGKLGIHIEKEDRALAPVQIRKFIERTVGTKANYTKSDLLKHMDGKIEEFVPDLIANVMEDNNIGILHVTTKLRMFSEEICKQLKPYFDDFGISLDNFSFNKIAADESDLARLKEARNAAMEKDIASAATARQRQREGYTYQQERGFDVLGQAASNEGTASPMMGMGMGLGMGAAVGGAFGGGMNAMAQNALNPTELMTAKPASQTLCPKCKSPVEAGAKFCNNCGAKLIEETLCPGCGKPIKADSKFCPECGYKLVKVCPNCGKEVGTSKFCPDCGTAIE